jgi:hypothetical protein
MSAPVQVFGRRDDGPIHALGRPASEKRQGTKSRAVGHWQGSERYEDCISAIAKPTAESTTAALSARAHPAFLLGIRHGLAGGPHHARHGARSREQRREDRTRMFGQPLARRHLIALDQAADDHLLAHR